MRSTLILCSFALMVSLTVSAQAPSYNALVQQGNAHLQAGSNDLALTTANSAIKLNAKRWEAYALAGGALMNLKRYEEAEDQFGHAIDRAPESKQAGLRNLRKQCLLAESGTYPAPTGGSSAASIPGPSTQQAEPPTPSTEDTLAWLNQRVYLRISISGSYLAFHSDGDPSSDQIDINDTIPIAAIDATEISRSIPLIV